MTKHKLLIVDDEQGIHEAFKATFEDDIADGELTLDFCDNGQECLELLTSDPEKYREYTIIADLNMPRMDGFQLLEFVKEKHPQINISVASAYSSEEYKSMALKKGAKNYFIKPLDLNEIKDIILKK